MKYSLVILGLLFCSFTGFAQEFKVPRAIAVGQVADFGLGKRSVPSLSFLAPEIPSPNLSIREVNWNKEVKREVNLVAMMEQQRYETESAYVELEFGAPQLQSSEKGMINITNQISIYGRDKEYDPFTGKSLNPALREAQSGLFKGKYSPYTGRSYYNPYSYY
ncbi:MAG: hypothetical protein WBL27_05930 [Salinimicrobium sp.]